MTTPLSCNCEMSTNLTQPGDQYDRELETELFSELVDSYICI